MEPNKSKTYSDFIGPRQSIAGSLTESACVDVILGYLRKFHLDEIDALIPESVFQLPFPHDGRVFWNNECTVEYTDDVIFDIYFTNPTIFFDYVRKGISALKKEKGSASSAWMYLQIKLIEDKPYDLSEIKPHMVNTPVCFDAVVLGLEPRIMYIKTAWYECPKGHPGIDVQCDKHRQLHPQVCTHSLGIDTCGEKMFLNIDKSIQDYSQNIVIQEPIENTKFGNPIEYDAKITGVMVGDVRVSQKMRMSAVLRTVVDRKKNENEIYYDILSYKDLADSKEVLPTEEELATIKKDVEEPDFMLKLIKSFAPEVYGLDSVKESLILGLAGGVRARNKRGSVNILLLGDPSTAKSTLLKECAAIITKSLYTSGKSASAAGLTAAAVKRPNGAWMIMPGVVVLCNDGFVFIDEIDKATPEDRSSLHEAMEQQTVSIAKAGMHMTFPARTAVFAAGNPQTGKWELSLSAAENVNLPPTLLSRFDVKWRILDQKDFSRDTNMAEHILSQFTDPAEETFNRDYLRKYFAYINKLKPKLTKEAQKELLNTYRKLRDKSKDQESVIIDTRQLEGLIRLSTAHAKCYLHDTIVEADVVHAVKVYYESLKSFGFDPEEGTVDQSTFFTSAKLNKETTFWNAFTALDDEAKGGVDAEELMVKLSQSPHYEEESARQEVEKKHSKENKIYMSKTGRYMRV